MSQCRHSETSPANSHISAFACNAQPVTVTMQLLLQFASLHQTGNDFQEDPTTRGSEPLTRSETTEHRSFLCVEEGSLSRTLEFNGVYSYAQEKYATKEREIF